MAVVVMKWALIGLAFGPKEVQEETNPTRKVQEP